MKKVLSIICVLALVVTVASSFTYAATPETAEVVSAGEGARTSQYKVTKTGTYMYNLPSLNSGYVRPQPFSVGTVMNFISDPPNDDLFYKMSYGSYSGYVLKSHLTVVY